MIFTVLLVAVVVLAIGFAALAIRRDNAKANQVVAGAASSAPLSWAGAHTPEARLHRRLVDAVAALPDDDLDVRRPIEEVALSVDEQLVAVARLPERVRAEPLAQVADAVARVEDAVAAVSLPDRLQLQASMDAALAQAKERVALLAQARDELEAGG